LNAFPGKFDLILKKRLGFIKLALQQGASLVPVFSFGETDIWDQVPNPVGSALRNFQEWFEKLTKFAPPILRGRGMFTTDGMLPFRHPIVTIGMIV
jgi:2-acylglycerol O-acyltransferase 2